MDKKEFINQLRVTAAELKPLAESATSVGLTWSGTEYTKSSESKKTDPYALAWWSTLNTIVGGTKDRPALEPKSGTTFNFVITSPQPFTTTNLTVRVTFTRLILAGSQVADPEGKKLCKINRIYAWH